MYRQVCNIIPNIKSNSASRGYDKLNKNPAQTEFIQPFLFVRPMNLLETPSCGKFGKYQFKKTP